MRRIKIFLNVNNQAKKEAVQEILDHFIKKNSKVKFQLFSRYRKIDISETPINDLTPKGAELRAERLKEIINEDQSIFMGVESGLVKRHGHFFEECWACLIYKDKKYFGYSSGLLLPAAILKKLNKKTHVEIMKQLEKVNHISSKETWGNYTKNILQRKTSFLEAIRNAFASFLTDNHLLR